MKLFKNPRASATDLNAELRTNYGAQVSVDTVRRRLRVGDSMDGPEGPIGVRQKFSSLDSNTMGACALE
jgi:hypothetical protein